MIYRFSITYLGKGVDATLDEMKISKEQVMAAVKDGKQAYVAMSEDKDTMAVTFSKKEVSAACKYCESNTPVTFKNPEKLFGQMDDIIQKREKEMEKERKVEPVVTESERNDEDSQETNPSSEADVVGLSNSNLPEINPGDRKATLCIKDGYKLEIMPVYNAENLIVESCKLFLVQIATNTPMLGAGRELQLDKNKILDATDHSIFKVIRKFLINFTEDDLKLAFERAKLFLENSTNMVGINSSMNIMDAYREAVCFAIEKAGQEDKSTMTQEERRCKYDKENKIVSIRDKYMKELLEEIGSGYTPVIFCKKLCMTEAYLGESILIHNRGRYACNEAGNQRFYKLKVIDELIGKGGAA